MNWVATFNLLIDCFAESAETGALKITRMSKSNGSVIGAEEIYMFVEKVSKSNNY